ncbi:hypothetical protein C5167_023059 [Papaver somniferum]|uniref:Uncharacterized protein n=1 Tax=Papaver somniferum TaxID=3469 RepID=A0A4Y7JNC9_PAPSO|nr:hypothetical protein C5167_023059 [Papaver somniferum]
MVWQERISNHMETTDEAEQLDFAATRIWVRQKDVPVKEGLLDMIKLKTKGKSCDFSTFLRALVNTANQVGEISIAREDDRVCREEDRVCRSVEKKIGMKFCFLFIVVI